jgi:penicillin-binding protein 2
VKLQALAERMLQGKIGSVVAIEPSTGEVLALVSSPTYDPRTLVGRMRSKTHRALSRNVWKPLLNRAIMGQYPPGSTFKTTQALTYLTEGIITPSTMFPCNHGFSYHGLHVGCHGHPSPLNLIDAISTSCNGYFCWGLYHMMSNRSKYRTVEDAMNVWRDYMVSMGFGYKLGIDLPGEKRGLIPNSSFYDKAYHGSWNGLTVISIAIGQGEVNLTPLQIANLGATIANRGYYYIPHVVRKVQYEPLDTTFMRRHRTKASERAYRAVIAGMRSSALKGTCKALAHLPFTVCGKTGTAQNRGQDHSVFMGFAPMDKPKIAIAVYVENGGFGADFAVPIAGVLFEQYMTGKLSPSAAKQADELQKRRIAYGSRNR